jgi:hypothetical protein
VYSPRCHCRVLGMPSSAGRFLPLLTGSWFCTSQQLVHRQLRGTYEFCLWISMPDGQ